MTTREFNFDGLIGPTHNYAGLAQGNLASQEHGHQTSHPKSAALQGLEKMKLLADLGVAQAILPPQDRPDVAALRRLGFTGSDSEIIQRAAKDSPQLLAACSSASSMWAANAATISPSADTADVRLHITPANLISHLHRSLEAASTAKILRAIFPTDDFEIHDPLPASHELADEGAANHTRLFLDDDKPGIELFTFGRDPAVNFPNATRYTPRQSRLASSSIARLHQLNPAQTFYAQQSAAAIDAGVFHNDVIALGHRQIFLYHEQAYADAPSLIESLRRGFSDATGGDLLEVLVPEKIIPLSAAVASYLFNSQLVTLPSGSIAMILPTECREIPAAEAAVDFIRARVPSISSIHYVDVRQSMHNGGGPACLRLRVMLTAKQQSAMHPSVIFTPALYHQLKSWITRHYRDDLRPADLADPKLLAESRTALDELTTILNLRVVYSFQR